LASERRCPGADQAITNLGNEDKNLPFSFFSFGQFQKRLRVQFLVASVEFACVDEKSARKHWEKLSKASADLASTDYAFPYLAQSKLNPDAGKEKLASALEMVNGALASAAPDRRGLLLYHKGLLLLAGGEARDAETTFTAGAAAGTGFVRYLNLDVLRTLAKPHF
jgi:hypothetical protein